MTSLQTITNKSKAHPAYKLQDGTRVPSVTTVLNELAKPALIHWAWGLGMKGIDYKAYKDALADVGTLTHDMILADLRGEDPRGLTAGFSPETVDLAENCFLSYLNWKSKHEIIPIALELPLVSELYRYGGRCDFFGKIDGRLNLVDFKTGKAIYPEHFIQLSGYAPLLLDNNVTAKAIEEFRVVNIPRGESEAFDEKLRTSLSAEWRIFKAALEIYYAKKEMDR